MTLGGIAPSIEPETKNGIRWFEPDFGERFPAGRTKIGAGKVEAGSIIEGEDVTKVFALRYI